MKAYVYAVVVDGIVRYIGKGSGGRIRAHMRLVRSIARRRAAGEVVRTSHFYNRLTKAWLAGAEIEEIIIADKMTDEQAYTREIAEIAATSQNQLWNVWIGGEGSSKGYAKSVEQNRKIAETNRKTWSDPKLLAEHSERCKVVWLRPDYRARLMGRKWTREMRAALSAKRKAQWANPEFRRKMMASFSTENFKETRKLASELAWAARKQKRG